MEPWSYASDGRGLLFSDEVGLHLDAFARSKKPLMEWDNKPTYNFESGALVSDSEVAESVEFLELGIPDLVRKTCRGNQGVEKLNSEVGSGSCKRAASPSRMVTSNSCFEEVASEPKLSSSAMEATVKDSLLIDLKLGILADCKDEEDSKLLKYRPDLLCTRPSLLTKKARKTSSYSQPAFCQVHGCNKDLSSSKDYHKRHKVCDVHSKTTKVIVNGIEQRFCQQCSRFHLLAEFDDGKRSCRKRLAGHNERRRKPQQDTLSGSRYQGTSLPKRTPFVLPNMHHSGVVCPGKYERANGLTHIKLEGESFYNPQSAIPTRTGQLLQKSFFHLHGTGKQHSFGVSASGSEDCNINIPTIQEFSGASISSRALSLLSAQSQELSSHLTGTPMASPEIIHGGSSHHGAGQISDSPLRVSSVEQYGPNGVYSYWRNATELDKMGSTMVSDARHAADFEAHTNDIFQETDILKAKYCPPENGPTVDWLQLSSHLQRVELQKHSFQVKREIEENEESYYFPNFRSVCNQQG